MLAGPAAALLAVLGPGSASVAARPAPATVPAAAPEGGSESDQSEELLLEVFINGAPTGKIGEFVRRDGRLYSAAAELRDLGLRADAASGAAKLALADLPGVACRLSETDLKIYFEVEAAALIPHAIGGRADADASPLRPGGTGLLINYDAAATVDRSGLSLSSLIEARAFSGIVSAGSRFIAGTADGGAGLVRLDTDIIVSDPAHLRRLTIGDLITSALSWTRPVRLGGIQASTAFEMRPDLVTYPLPTIRGTIAVPSTVDILVDGVRQLTSNVQAGPFYVAQMPVASGSQTIAVQMRDALGRMTQMDVSTYASASLLAPGLSSFSVEAGAIRSAFGVSSGDYRNVAASATYRHGFGTMTLEAHAEAARGIAMAGAGASFTISDLAAATLAVAASDFDGHVGTSLYAGIERQTPLYHVSLTAHLSGKRFGDLAAASGDPAPQLFVQASAGTFLGRWGSFNLGYIHVRSRQPLGGLLSAVAADPLPSSASYRLSVATLGYSRPLGRGIQFSATGFHDFQGNGSGVTINLSMPLGGRRQIGASVSHADGGSSAALDMREVARNVGDLGWEMLATEGETARGFAQAQIRTRYGTFGGGIDVSGANVTAQASASGSLTWMDGSLFAANVIRDSFAIVDMNGQAGVPVLEDNQPVGRTNGSGKLILTDLRSFDVNRIAFESKDLPLNAAFGQDQLLVRTLDHAGVVARFDIREGSAVLVVLVDEKGEPIGVGSSARLDGTGEAEPVGYDGQLFLPATTAHNRVFVDTAEGRKCVASFDFTAPAKDIAQIGPIVCRSAA
jgi:outer membrane usher protein